MPYPLNSNVATAAHTQGKKLPKTRTHSASRSGGSSRVAATGRRTMKAKNLPPTQMTANKTCKVRATCMLYSSFCESARVTEAATRLNVDVLLQGAGTALRGDRPLAARCTQRQRQRPALFRQSSGRTEIVAALAARHLIRRQPADE